MKILGIRGSPRKGNPEAIILKIQQLLRGKGVENEADSKRKIDLAKKSAERNFLKVHEKELSVLEKFVNQGLISAANKLGICLY